MAKRGWGEGHSEEHMLCSTGPCFQFPDTHGAPQGIEAKGKPASDSKKPFEPNQEPTQQAKKPSGQPGLWCGAVGTIHPNTRLGVPGAHLLHQCALGSAVTETRIGGQVLTSRHLAPALLEMYTLVLLAKLFPTDPMMQEEQALFSPSHSP